MPQAVFNEVTVAGIGKPGAKSLQSADWQGRVRASPIPDPLLVMELDAGEAEVISLARQLSPCVAVIDERRGRRIAQQVYGLPVKGTAGILVEAHRRGLISGVRSSLVELRVAGYFIADSVIAAALPGRGGIACAKVRGRVLSLSVRNASLATLARRHMTVRSPGR